MESYKYINQSINQCLVSVIFLARLEEAEKFVVVVHVASISKTSTLG